MKGGRNSAITISPIGSVLRCPAVCVLKTKNWTFITYDPRETDAREITKNEKREKITSRENCCLFANVRCQRFVSRPQPGEIGHFSTKPIFNAKSSFFTFFFQTAAAPCTKTAVKKRNFEIKNEMIWERKRNERKIRYSTCVRGMAISIKRKKRVKLITATPVSVT